MADTLDFPFDEVAEGALDLVRKGHTVYQKFTCAGCGERQTIDVPNKFFTRGKCEECGEITDIRGSGCNFLLVAKTGGDGEIFAKIFERRARRPQ